MNNDKYSDIMNLCICYGKIIFSLTEEKRWLEQLFLV